MIHLGPYSGTEREVEIPFLVESVYGRVLDVGADHVGYTKILRERGCTVHSVDPSYPADFRMEFQDLPQFDEKYDCVALVSALEHFDATMRNLKRCETEVYVVSKCRELLNSPGRIVLTVPFGREYIHGDFINFSWERIERIQEMTDIGVLREHIYRYEKGAYVRSTVEECRDIPYQGNGAPAAGAVYCGVWIL